MKILIISDIHGSYSDLTYVLENESFDQLVILGDLYSYSSYITDNDEMVLNEIIKYKNKLTLIKGNCDYKVSYDANSLIVFDTITLPFNNHLVTFTHGHIYKKGFLPSNHGDIFISGHTHIPCLQKEKDIIYANPGSISKPRFNTSKCYLVFEDNKLILKTIDKIIVKEMILN